ncbi:MAG: acyl-CoA synthetase [Rhodospirillales bacterium]|nr:acyl-CoA synthetase [Rhodospirillales bacterium]
MPNATIFEQDLDRNTANYTPLTPLSFLARTAAVYPEKISVVHGSKRFTWAETYARCRRLAGALAGRGIGLGDTVAVMGANTPEMVEAAFGVPMTGAVLNTLNVRLDSPTIAFCLTQGEAKVLITDTEFSPTIKEALAGLDRDLIIIDIDDSEAEEDISRDHLGEMDYESFLREGDADFDWQIPEDEWQAISLNYTSGTTGDPKGVVYHHRGAYLNAVSNIIGWNMAHHPIYLWTLPMFHCNGWCFPWSIAAVAGTNICLRRVNAANIYAAIADHGVTHFCGAPIVLNFVVNATDEERRSFDHTVNVMTAAAPPPASTLEGMQRQGFNVTHVYGLTETYGPAVICSWHDDWNEKPIEEQAELKSRQGVNYHMLQGVSVMNPDTMKPVPRDGETLGEVMFRGNVVMKGYLKNKDATEAALKQGWFHSGDLGVTHPDGYLQIMDRSKDIIISGGENISSIEVENVLYKHPDVLAAAVVAKPDDKWGETPCAFIELKDPSRPPTEQDIIDFCRDNIARFKAPKTVIFGPIPKTSTGKIQKFKLREQAKET